MKFNSCLLVLAALSLAASADVYKWVDKDGKTQYTDTPPPASQSKAEAKTLKLPPPGPASSGKATEPKDPLKDAVRTKAEKEAKALKDQQAELDGKNAKINADNCKEAKSYAAHIDSGTPIKKTNESGEREILSDEQRAAERARTQSAMSESCK